MNASLGHTSTLGTSSSRTGTFSDLLGNVTFRSLESSLLGNVEQLSRFLSSSRRSVNRSSVLSLARPTLGAKIYVADCSVRKEEREQGGQMVSF